MATLPSIFVTHGAPTLPVDPCPARDFLAALGRDLPRPEAILCVSAHWEQNQPTVSTAAKPETIHDFFGFPPALYEIGYPAPGAPALADRVTCLLDEAGLGCTRDPERGLDHGAWAPMTLIWPKADVPVAQLSVQTALGPDHHLALGAALAPLRQEGVLILASGSATHNLRDWHRYQIDSEPADYAAAFAHWLDDRVAAGDREALADYQSQAPEGRRNHPSPEHFLPLFVAMGAGGGAGGRRLHDSYTYGVFYMGAYAFEGAA